MSEHGIGGPECPAVDWAPTVPSPLTQGQQCWLDTGMLLPSLLHWSLPQTLWAKPYDCAHSTDEETEGWTEVTQLRIAEPAVRGMRVCLTPRPQFIPALPRVPMSGPG